MGELMWVGVAPVVTSEVTVNRETSTREQHG